MRKAKLTHTANASASPGPALSRTVFWLALPAVGEQLLNTAIGLTNQYFVGHLDPEVGARLGYDQATALTAVGLASLLAWIMTTLFMGVEVGVTALVARRVGEGRQDAANDALRQALLVGVVIGVASTLLTVWLSEWLLMAIGAPPTAIAPGAAYLRIVAVSFVPTAILFAGTAALRGAGDTRSPLYLMLVVVGVNFVLSLLLVNGVFGAPALGVEGAAIAATCGRLAGGLMLAALLLANRLRLRPTFDWRPNWQVIGTTLCIGLPSAGEYLVFQASILLMARLITDIGTAAYAAHSVVTSIESVSFLPGIGFGVAATTLVGQALGAGSPDRAKGVAWGALWQGSVVMTLIGLLMVFWPATMVAWITSDPDVIREAQVPLQVAGVTQPLLALSFILVGALRGAGDTTWPLLMCIISTWCIRVPVILTLLWLTDWGLVGVWIAMFADYAVQGVLILKRFLRGTWMAIKV